MNKLELIEKIKTNMPIDLNETEIAKYIYIQLGKEKAFDEKYFFGNSKTRKKIYQMAEKTKNNTDIVAKNKKIICVSLSYLFKDILKQFDIASEIQQEEDHRYVIIFLKDGRKIKADLQLDLYNIQSKSKTKYFGTASLYEYLDNLEEHENLEIDKKIGYIEDERDYRNNVIENIIEKVKGKSPCEALDILITDKELNTFENKLEIIEMIIFYRAVFNKAIPQYMQKNVFSFICYKENNKEKKEYTMCVYSSEKEDTNIYLFSNKENRFMHVDIEKIEELEYQGLVLGLHDNENGVKKLKNVIKRNKQRNVKQPDEH